ncbi:Rho GTPase activating protein [Trema orientale]|uniref:Rho GTPase activating protein n=1 Tax=Trema orientale TaxID=63057 RepID=A0A2P5FA85_TREOI|nr:Rho GTPase activating protein [Trema orientale]
MSSKVVYEGWMVRYGRRKIGRSFIHMRYFVLESRLLAYYKRKPQDNQVPIKTMLIDGNCRVEDRGLKTHHGHMVYVLSVYNKKEKYHRITMAAFNIQEALIWKEKIELVIDQHQGSEVANGNRYISFEYKSGMDNGRTASSSDHESQFSAQEDEDDAHPNLLRRTTIGNGPPESIFDWTREIDSDLSNQNINNQAFSRKLWRLLQCQNGLRIFEELLEVEYLPRSCSRAMKAVGVVEASCEEIFELVMSMDGTRFEWDCSFQYGSLVEEVDGHTAILYHRLQLDWFPMVVWPRDLCYVRYWRRNDDGSYVVLFRSREHENCGPQPGYVRAHIESKYNISHQELVPGSLLQRFVDGDDDFRNSRLKLIPSVPKGSWIVRQSVGSTPCLLGKAVDCNYIRGAKYLEIDVDIGSSTVANGVLGLVVGVITTLVVDMAFLVQANTTDELPERLIGAVRASHIELKSAIVPKLEPDAS